MADQLAQVVQYAQSKLGDPYVWGATGPNSFDCSGLVYAAYKAAGVPVSRTTAAKLGTMGKAVSQANAKPGDVVYFDEPGATDHVGIYIGNGQMIDAPHTGANVEVDSVKGATSFRDLGASGSGSSALDWALNPIGTAASTATDAIGSVFSGWQTDLYGVVLKAGAGLIVGAVVVAGVVVTFRDSDK